MSNLSNYYGRAYEYAFLLVLKEVVEPYRNIIIEKNSSFIASQKAWNLINNNIQSKYLLSARAGVKLILDLEPLIIEDGKDDLDVMLQPDQMGKMGDVRDLLIIRRNIKWEIGLSIKHNHFAVKHSRLSKKNDFGQKWYGVECSTRYWNEIAPIFDILTDYKKSTMKWSELSTKEDDVYIPLLKAFLNEIRLSYDNYGDVIPKKMIEYLLGQFDFYKVIGIDNKRLTQVQSYNLRGTLNKPSKKKKPKIIIPIPELPTRIICTEFKPESKNTVEIYMNNGWQLAFRIHNASTFVESSLKFDIQLIGMPASIICIDHKWIDK